jgi:hypothetical protein
MQQQNDRRVFAPGRNRVQPHVSILEEHSLQRGIHVESVTATGKPAATLRGASRAAEIATIATLPQNTLTRTSNSRCQRFHSQCIMHSFQTTRSSKEVFCVSTNRVGFAGSVVARFRCVSRHHRRDSHSARPRNHFHRRSFPAWSNRSIASRRDLSHRERHRPTIAAFAAPFFLRFRCGSN